MLANAKEPSPTPWTRSILIYLAYVLENFPLGCECCVKRLGSSSVPGRIMGTSKERFRFPSIAVYIYIYTGVYTLMAPRAARAHLREIPIGWPARTRAIHIYFCTSPLTALAAIGAGVKGWAHGGSMHACTHASPWVHICMHACKRHNRPPRLHTCIPQLSLQELARACPSLLRTTMVSSLPACTH